MAEAATGVGIAVAAEVAARVGDAVGAAVGFFGVIAISMGRSTKVESRSKSWILSVEFEAGRHVGRINKIKEIEDKQCL